MTKDVPNPEDSSLSDDTGGRPAEEPETPEDDPAATPAPSGETEESSPGGPADPEPSLPAEESSAEEAGSTEQATEDKDPATSHFTEAGRDWEPGDSRQDVPEAFLPPPRIDPPRRANWIKGVLDLCLILILAGLAGAVYLLYQMQLDQDQAILAEVDRVESRLNDLEAHPPQDAQARRSLQVLDKKLKSLSRGLGKSQQRQDHDLDRLKEQMASLSPTETPAEPGTIPLGPDAGELMSAGEPTAEGDAAAGDGAAEPEEAPETDSGSGPVAETDEEIDENQEEAPPQSEEFAELSAASEEMDEDALETDETEAPPVLTPATPEEPGAADAREPEMEAEPAVTPTKAPQQKYIEFVESTAHRLWGWVKENASHLGDWIADKLREAWKA